MPHGAIYHVKCTITKLAPDSWEYMGIMITQLQVVVNMQRLMQAFFAGPQAVNATEGFRVMALVCLHDAM